MKISSLAELRELLQLVVEQDIESLELGDLKVTRKSRAAHVVFPIGDAPNNSEDSSEAGTTDEEELLYWSAEARS